MEEDWLFYGQDFTIQSVATKSVFCVFFLVLLDIHSLAAIADVRYIKILTWLRGFLFIFLCLVWFSLCSALFGIARQESREKLDCEQFQALFCLQISWGDCTRAWASSSQAAWREKRGWQPEKPLSSRAFSNVRGHFRVSRLSLDGLRKKEDCS